MVNLSEEIPEIEGRGIASKAVFEAGKKGAITPRQLMAEINIQEQNYLNQPITRFALATSISLRKFSNISKIHVGRTQLIFETQLPKRFRIKEAEIRKEAENVLFAPAPTNYLDVRVHVSARSHAHAADKALDTLDLICGIWNLFVNRKHSTRWSFGGKPKPVNKIILGPSHFLHFPDGKLASEPEEIKRLSDTVAKDFTQNGPTIAEQVVSSTHLASLVPLRQPESPAHSGLVTLATYTYDGDGVMVKSVIDSVTTFYVGGYYEIEVDGANTTERKYYSAAGMRIALRTQVNGGEETLNWLLSDHLGSTSMTTDASGNVVSEVRYSAFGEMRYQNGTTPTDYLYTGQRQEAELGLYYYVARWYDPAIGRFIQADTIVPDPDNPIAFDRYAYAYNNPLNYIDSSGHWPELPPLPDPFIPATKLAVDLAVDIYNYIKNAPPIKEPRALEPTSNNVTGWVAGRITEDTGSDYAAEIRDNLNIFKPEDSKEALHTWVSLVRTKGIWDYKVELQTSKVVDDSGNIEIGGYTTNWQAVANYTYGATAASVGMPLWMAQAGAGAFQYLDHQQDKDNRGNFDTFFDDPFDFWWIAAGYDLWENYGDDGIITDDEITSHITNYLDTYGEPPNPLSLGQFNIQ